MRYVALLVHELDVGVGFKQHEAGNVIEQTGNAEQRLPTRDNVVATARARYVQVSAHWHVMT